MPLVKSILLLFLFDIFVLAILPIFLLDNITFASAIIAGLNAVIGLSVFYLKGNYSIQKFNISLKKVYLLFEGVLFVNILLCILMFFVADNPADYVMFLIKNIVLTFGMLLIGRLSVTFFHNSFLRDKKCLIIGTNQRAKDIAAEIRKTSGLKMQVFGFVQEGVENYCSENEKVFGNPKEIYPILNENNIDVVIVTENSKYFLDIPKSVKIFKMTDLFEKITRRYYVDKDNVNELFYYFQEHKSLFYDAAKRIFDVISAIIISVTTLPIMLYIAIRVFFTDKHSPLYTQSRVTKNKKIFKAYKLRTMYINDYKPTSTNLEEAENQCNDNRVIPFCQFVRKARFDEIPQMINIIKGEMSIVGPRAEWNELVKVYEKEIPFHNCRHWVKTAWTGWAQINQGHCFSGDNEQIKLEYDLYYIKHRNLIWEIGILVKAVFMALGGRHG